MLVFLADAYFHSLDPVAIPISGAISVRWYGLAYATGFLLGWLFYRWMAKTDRSPLSVQETGDLMFYLILGVLLGGRLGYVVFYKPALFISFNTTLPFWGVLAINEGGMASHGGIIGVILAVWLFCRRHKVSILHVLDLSALACTVGLMLGRLANFINGELLGRALPPEMQANPPAWSVQYPEEVLSIDFQGNAERSAQFAENLSVIPGANLMKYRDFVGMARAGNAEIIEAMRPVLTAYYPSQLFQAITDGPILALILILIWLKPRMPGVIGCWFLIAYGGLRMATEFFRQPDEGIPLLLGLSRGQVLSILLIGSGFVILRIVTRRDVEPMGGLKRGKKNSAPSTG